MIFKAKNVKNAQFILFILEIKNEVEFVVFHIIKS